MEDRRGQSILHPPFSVFRWTSALLWKAGIFYFSSSAKDREPCLEEG